MILVIGIACAALVEEGYTIEQRFRRLLDHLDRIAIEPARNNG
jgi:hypothetical protein